MKYFKIIKDNNIIGIVTSNDFLGYIPRLDYFIRADETTGEYVSYKGKYYRSYWMQPYQREIEHIVAEITSISEEEYNILKEALEENEEIIIEPDDGNDEPEIPVIPDQPEDPDITLEFVRNSKLSEMSRACRETIESGIEIMIRGETKHFSLTTQDQLNLMSLSVMAQTQSLIPYHADGEETDFYTSEEINQIVETANALKIQHTTYYNALKTYINALETIEDISAITYGVQIPDEYKSDVLKVLEQ